jgi:hypothetical protein
VTIPAPHPDNALPWGTVGPADWQEGITAIVGSGPSLAGVDLDVLRSFPAITHTIAVKEAAWDMPWADACVCVDQKWPRRRDLNALPVPLYLCLGEPYVGPIPTGSTFLRRFVHGPLSDRPDALAQGCTSGYAALNFAILKGARKILLLGYDYRHGRDGKHHGRPEWNPWYPPANARLWTYWRDPFNAIAGTLRSRGVVVVNASPGSALDAFPIHPLPCAVARLAGVGPSGRCSLPSGKGEHPAARQPAG